jgi:hypothetical protein
MKGMPVLCQSAVQMAERFWRDAECNFDLHPRDPQPVLLVPADLAGRRRHQTSGIFLELTMREEKTCGKAIRNSGRQQLRWRGTSRIAIF